MDDNKPRARQRVKPVAPQMGLLRGNRASLISNAWGFAQSNATQFERDLPQTAVFFRRGV